MPKTTEQVIDDTRQALAKATGTDREAAAKNDYADAWAARCAEIHEQTKNRGA